MTLNPAPLVAIQSNRIKSKARRIAYAIVCQRTDDPCGGEFGVVDWGGPMMTLAGGEWGIAP